MSKAPVLAHVLEAGAAHHRQPGPRRAGATTSIHGVSPRNSAAPNGSQASRRCTPRRGSAGRGRGRPSAPGPASGRAGGSAPSRRRRGRTAPSSSGVASYTRIPPARPSLASISLATRSPRRAARDACGPQPRRPVEVLARVDVDRDDLGPAALELEGPEALQRADVEGAHAVEVRRDPVALDVRPQVEHPLRDEARTRAPACGTSRSRRTLPEGAPPVRLRSRPGRFGGRGPTSRGTLDHA